MAHTSQQKAQRPLSPHLEIYKSQVTSVLSITHRATGAFLFVGVLLMSWWVIMRIYHMDAVWDVLPPVAVQSAIILWSMAFFYHLLNGIRHLFWDAGKGYTMPVVRASGIAVIVGTLILTFLSWGLSLLWPF